MIDTHAHLFDDAFDENVSQVLADSFESGIEAIILPAIEPKTFSKMFDLVQSDKRLFCSIGIHPHNAKEVNDENLGLIFDYLENENLKHKIKAIGEIGLDYYYDFAPKEVQIEAFRKQIQVAKKFNLPIIVHNRESDEDLLSILKSEQDGNLRGVLHCFSSNEATLGKALDLGFLVSFTGNITFKKADELRKVVSYCPIEKIMLETDSPYMAPVPFRGKRNEPKYLKLVAEHIGLIKSLKIDEVIKMTTKNAKEFFKLFLLVFVFSSLLFSQSLFAKDEDYSDNNENSEYDNTKIQKEEENPFYKLVGIGFNAGTNTVVNTFYPEGQDNSQEGILSLDASLTYNFIDWAFVQFLYMNFKFNKPNIDTKGVLDPEISNSYQAVLGVTPNPYGRVNLYGMIGYSITNKKFSTFNYSTLTKSIYHQNYYGIITGLGFNANIPIEKAGLFMLNAEWRLIFILDRTHLLVDPRIDYKSPDYNTPTEFSTFYSIPRFGITWYPPFNEWF